MTAADRDEFARVYDEHIWDVYGFFGYRLNSREACEDLTQQTFERALRAWARFDATKATPKTWLLAIARNLLIDHYRRGSGARRSEPLDEDAIARIEDEPRSSGEPRLGVSPDLERALHSLDSRSRELVALRYGGDLSGPEIAELTGLSLANVQQILSRSLRRMRDALESQDSQSPNAEPLRGSNAPGS